MKRIPFFLISIALALFIINGCEQEDFSNPNYDRETNSVLTKLVFNISTASNATKQSAGAVQATSSNSFRGITDAILLTYKQTSDSKILAADATAEKKYDLAEVVSANKISSTDSRRVLEMSLPLQTNTLLFYGRAPEATSTYGGYSLKECYGYLDVYKVNETVGSAEFTLGKQLTETSKFYVTTKLLAGIFSVIMNTNLKGDNHVAISATAVPATDVSPYKFDVATTDYGQIGWSDYANVDGKSPVETTHDLYPIEEKLANAYKQMITIQSGAGELRAASGQALIRTMQDLWTIVNEVRCSEPLNKPEAVAKYLATRIYIRINKYFDATTKPTDGGPITGTTFQAMNAEGTGIIPSFTSDIEIADRPKVTGQSYSSVWPSADELNTIATVNLANFPFNFNLPRGATHMAFDATRLIFYYPETFNTSGMGGVMEGGNFNAESYFYPPELLYFGNSPVRTSDTDHTVTDYPTGAGTGTGKWGDDGSWTSDWNGTNVKASTRSVAMKYDINYGTALLSSQVKYGAATLKDNNRAVQAYYKGVDLSDDAQAAAFAEQDNDIAVTETSFLFTGIIIGGQSQSVGWDFLPMPTGASPEYHYGFIYDRAIPNDDANNAQSIPEYTTAGNPSKPNYTMVFDNFKAAGSEEGIWSAATQDKVYVALEFQNNTGKDFYGNYNLIHDGGYFYLIAELNPASATDPTWPSNYILPPYTAAGASNQVKRVFMQDYMTSAVFTLGVNSLKHAYLTVPDLRSGSMTLGLSVDVKWSTGLQFEDVILGGN